ncbi:integrase arm-type DNA-binding domain-containing protein [Phenylobacterium sp.]|jgi:integrase|uniref:integrase arm-type DNA-binding domain-containing protein n=1 Tax=Phenylobacterium sp. TaxID=1871053 RepID=UPI002F3E5F22
MERPRTSLNDRIIGRLQPAESGQYIVRDADLAGFFVVVGTRKKTFTVQCDFWKNGRRRSTRLALGSSETLTTRAARIAAKAALARIASGQGARDPEPSRAAVDITLRQAWLRYRSAHLERKGRGERTIDGYAYHVEHMLADWLDRRLRELGEAPELVVQRHDALTASSGPYAANGCMRTLRAIYNHARRSVRGLPPENPAAAVDWNEELRRDAAMGGPDLAAWIAQAGRLANPIRREFHLFVLLSGSRPTALKAAKLEDLDLAGRVLRITRPKGGARRAFDIPLSRQMILCLVRAMRASRMLHPKAAATWIFAGAGGSGRLSDHKEDRDKVLGKWGNDLRHTYRTLGQAAGVPPLDMHLLMNHSVRSVNEGYITRSKLLDDHLRAAQQRISDHILGAGAAPPCVGSAGMWAWPRLPSRRIGAFQPERGYGP